MDDKSDISKLVLLTPEKLNKALPEIAFSLRPKIKGFSTDNLRQLISIIACHIRKDEEPTPLKITYIKKLVPQGDKYLKGLIDLGVVKRSGNYKPGVKSFKYSFSKYYRSKYVSQLLTNQKLIRRIKKTQSAFIKESSNSVRGKSEQIKFLKVLKIDPAYKEFINEKYINDITKFNYNLGSATRIENGEIFYSVDNTSGRFHSNVTNLSKDLRQFLRVNGEPLVNIDIKNSQPYLSTIILTNPSKVSQMTTNSDFSMLLQTLEVSQKEDVKRYISLVVSGEFYEYLQDKINNKGIQMTREETKLQVLRILFARNRKPKDKINKRCREIFQENFPTVHKIFSNVRGGNKKYKRFSVLLQTIEAYLMLKIIIKRIDRELQGVIAITIHDSIMTGILTNKEQEVQKIIKEELTRYVGFEPTIKVERNREIEMNYLIKGININNILKEEEIKYKIIDKPYKQYGATTAVCI